MVDPSKHINMAVTHLERVLNYAPMVAEGREAIVHLTPQDWKVLADALFQMGIPEERIPDAVEDYGLANENQTITLTTDDYDIEIEMVAS
jgi:hypothetical protein